MNKGRSRPSQSTLKQIETATKRINPRVDDVVDSFSPPLDPKLLEARYILCSAGIEKDANYQRKLNIIEKYKLLYLVIIYSVTSFNKAVDGERNLLKLM